MATTLTATRRPAQARRAASVSATSNQLSAAKLAPLRQASTDTCYTSSLSTTATAGIDPRQNNHSIDDDDDDDDYAVLLQILCDQLPTREYDECSSCSDITSAEFCNRQDPCESDNEEQDDVMSTSDYNSEHHGFEIIHNIVEEVLKEKIQPTLLFGVADVRVASLTLSECSAQSASSTVSQVVFFEDKSLCSSAGSRHFPCANTLQRRASDSCHREERAIVWERPGSLLHVGWTLPTERVEF